MKGCERDTDGDGNCDIHPNGCPPTEPVKQYELQFSCGALKTGYNGCFVDMNAEIGKYPAKDGRIRVMVYNEGSSCGPWVIPTESKLEPGSKRPHCLSCPCRRDSKREEFKAWPESEMEKWQGNPPKFRLKTVVTCMATEIEVKIKEGDEIYRGNTD